MSLKSLYQRFRAWQCREVTFERRSVTGHTCVNCGNIFDGDYCPICGQRYDIGPADWPAVVDDFKEFQGVSARSVLIFILNMLGRPGYMISDYIKGRRQVCSDPINVLCYVALITLLVSNIVGTKDPVTVADVEEGGVVAFIVGWLADHLEWAVIIETVLLVFPTWLLFRFSPKHSHHSIPAGIYIQLFMCSLVLLIILLRLLVAKWMIVLVPIYYCIAYKQLFGYGVWGTIWRTLLCLGIIFYFFGFSMWVALHISKQFWAEHTAWEFLSMFGAFLILGTGLLLLGYWISKKTART